MGDRDRYVDFYPPELFLSFNGYFLGIIYYFTFNYFVGYGLVRTEVYVEQNNGYQIVKRRVGDTSVQKLSYRENKL